MVDKLREILLTQYIGSILVALLSCQALITLITAVVRTGFWYVQQQRQHPQSVFEGSSSVFPWDTLIVSGVAIVLYLVAAYLLARWLFPMAKKPIPATDSENAQSVPDE